MEVAFCFGLTSWLILLLISLLSLVYRRTGSRKLIERIPGPFAPPLLGNAWQFLGRKQLQDTLGTLCRLVEPHARSRGIVRLWMGVRPMVILTQPHLIQGILNSPRHLTKADQYRFLHHWLGQGLLTSSGSKWHARRKLLTPTFHFRILDDFLEVFNCNSAILLRQMEKNGGVAFDVKPLLTLCTLDIICESAMGRSVNAQVHSESSYVRAVNEVGRIIMERTTKPWLYPDFLFFLSPSGKRFRRGVRLLHSFTNQVIAEKKRALKQNRRNKVEKAEVEGKKPRLAFLDLLLAEGGSLSDQEVREEVDTFMFEGHETTASAIAWALFLLGNNQEEQEMLHEELARVIGDEDTVTSFHLPQLKYMEAVIKESLRIYPSVPMLGRKLTEEAVVGEHVLPAGTDVLILTYVLHRLPELYPEPLTFRPDRFLKDEIPRSPFAYIPFSAGPRNCIGQKFALMEEKCVLAHIIRKYRVVSEQLPEDVHPLSGPILRAKNGIWIRLAKRS